MKQIKQDLLNSLYLNKALFGAEFIKNMQEKQTRQAPVDSSSIASVNANAQNTSQKVQSVLEKYKEDFKDMPKAFFDTVKRFEKNGYHLDKADLNELKTLFKNDSIDSKSTQFAIDKQLPIHADIISDVKNYLGASLLDFIDFSKKQEHENVKNELREYQNTGVNPSQNKSLAKNTQTLPADQTKDFITQIDAALEEMIQAIDEGRTKRNSDFSNDDFIESLEELKQAINKVREGGSAEENQLLNAALLTQNHEFKVILEEKITPKIAQIRSEFNELKLLISNNLEKIQESDFSNKSSLLAKTIELLDNAIMKSDISLYMDLKGERDLIKFSTQLNNASEMLQKGNYEGARTLLAEVSNELNEMVFKPSLKKVTALTDISSLNLKSIDFKDAQTFFKNTIDVYNRGEFEATKLLDYMRSLGINHEAESFQKLFPQLSGETSSHEQSDSSKAFSNSMRKDLFNIKEVLLALSNSSENISVGEKVKANSAICAINTNQYQNKLNEDRAIQEISLHIPLKFHDQVADVKVFIKSSQKNMKLDFANFNMYFVIHTQNEGDIGIRVSALDMKLKIEIRNDALANASRLKTEEAGVSFKEHIEAVGYSLIELKFSKSDEILSTISPEAVEGDLSQRISHSHSGFSLQV